MSDPKDLPSDDTGDQIACRVRRFSCEQSFGPYLAGDVVRVSRSELLQPAVRRILVTLEEEKQEREEAERQATALARSRLADIERARAGATEAHRRARHAEHRLEREREQ